MLRIFTWRGDAYALLARAARAVWGMETLPAVEREPGGKPWFPGRPDCHFNVSHSGGLALCALSDAPVGADIEVVRPRQAKLADYVLQGEARARYQALGGDWGAFYTLWTERESILKYTGAGLRAWRTAAVPAGCVLSRFRGPGWAACVCAREGAAELTWLDGSGE